MMLFHDLLDYCEAQARSLRFAGDVRLECTAHHDNSANNPDNADPTKEVTWGEQSWDEMMVGFFNLVFDANMPVQRLFANKSVAAIASN